MLKPTRVEEVQEMVRAYPRLRVRGGGTKPALSTPEEGEEVLELSGLKGILSYDPEEFVFTAYAGTPVGEIEEALKAHGQYLPFHPPLKGQGATLGGTVAAGLAGPMRERFGGVRDFILGVRFIDGEGNPVRGGGRVVKNAAGFPFHRLMVGALGAFGPMVELSFKVFPFPKATATLRVERAGLKEALSALERLRLLPLDLLALDLIPPGRLELRLGGFPKSLRERLRKLQDLLGPGEVLEEDEAHWEEVRDLLFLAESPIWAKVPAGLGAIPHLEALPLGPRRYLAGGEVLYVGLEEEGLRALREGGFSYLLLKGASQEALHPSPPEAFFRPIKRALDPKGRFPLR